MNKEERLREVQKRIAEARGYTDLRVGVDAVGREYEATTNWLTGVLHADEGHTRVPDWPQEWCDAGVLVEELEAAGFWWDAHRLAPYLFHFKATPDIVAVGQTLPEAIARCWAKWKDIDLSDIQ